MLTLRYNEPMFILMLRGRVGCLRQPTLPLSWDWLAASQSSSNYLTNFQTLQIPSIKSQVPHLVGSSNVELLNPLPHILVKNSTKQQGTIILFWNVTEHIENEASQSKKKIVNRHLWISRRGRGLKNRHFGLNSIHFYQNVSMCINLQH